MEISFERQYKLLLRRILKHGVKEFVNNHYTLRLFGGGIDIDVSKYFPIITGRRIFPNTFIQETKWIISGETSLKPLRQAGVSIWDSYGVEDIGQSYGANLRRWGFIQYDQWINVAYSILNEKTPSRRHVAVFYDPTAPLVGNVPPPCYVFVQFITTQAAKLHIICHYRSTDAFIGLVYDVGVFTLLLLEMCRLTGKEAGRVIIQFGDVHLYLNHVEEGSVDKYLNAPLGTQPTYNFKSLDDFHIINYKYKQTLKVKML